MSIFVLTKINYSDANAKSEYNIYEIIKTRKKKNQNQIETIVDGLYYAW